MAILKMTLKKKWFDMILSGEKKTEYRVLKPFWVKRLFYCKEFDKDIYSFIKMLIKEKDLIKLYRKDFIKIHFFNGGHFSEKLPNFIIRLENIQIGKGVEAWGAEKNEDYLCLHLGQITDKTNC